MELFYRKLGSGPPLIIVHGLYGSSDNWVSIAKKLSTHFEVFAIDQRNHGQSGHSKEHNYQLMVEDLSEFLIDNNIERPILLGHSMGGKVVINFAIQYPENISSLIVADIAPKPYSESDENTIYHKRILESLNSIDLKRIYSRKEVYEKLVDVIKSDKIVQFLLKNLHRKLDQSFEWRLNISTIAKNLENILKGKQFENLPDSLEITGFPVLFLKGENSNYINKDDYVLIHKIFPYAEIVTIKNAGHWLHAEQPDDFVNEIKQFVFN